MQNWYTCMLTWILGLRPGKGQSSLLSYRDCSCIKISPYKSVIISALFDCTVRPVSIVVRLQQNQIFSHQSPINMKFSKDIVLKSDVFFQNHIFLFKNRRKRCLAALSMTCLQSCWAFVLRWHTQMLILIWVIKVSREIESLHWATLHAIRRFFFNKINLTKLTRFLILIVSAMQVCAYRTCACSKVRFSRNNLPLYEIFKGYNFKIGR